MQKKILLVNICLLKAYVDKICLYEVFSTAPEFLWKDDLSNTEQ